MDVARVNGHNDICLELQKHIRKQRSKGEEEKHAGSHRVKEEHAGSHGVKEEHAGSQGVQGEHAGSQGVEGELHAESQGGEGEKLHARSQGKEDEEHTGRGRKPEGKVWPGTSGCRWGRLIYAGPIFSGLRQTHPLSYTCICRRSEEHATY